MATYCSTVSEKCDPQKEDFQHAKTLYKSKEYRIERMPTAQEFDDMLFGWNVEQGITSNQLFM